MQAVVRETCEQLKADMASAKNLILLPLKGWRCCQSSLRYPSQWVWRADAEDIEGQSTKRSLIAYHVPLLYSSKYNWLFPMLLGRPTYDTHLWESHGSRKKQAVVLRGTDSKFIWSKQVNLACNNARASITAGNSVNVDVILESLILQATVERCDRR